VSDSVRSVERALDILLCFSSEKPALSLTQIAERVGMHKSTTHRLLFTLEEKRFVQRDKNTGLYQLGFLFLELASVTLQDIDIQRWAQPYLQHLSNESGETVDLAVLDGSHVVYLQVVESPQRVKLAVAVGQQLPASSTATGKAFLAHMPEAQVRTLLADGLTQYTENTLTTFADLFQDLCEIRERGFAISEQEYENDINAVAAPILDGDDCPIAAVAIVGPSFRMPRERLMMLGKLVQETTIKITREVGLAALPAILPRKTIICLDEHSEREVAHDEKTPIC
jgi:IclR family transcriptional regulator, KDG regulon repressor